MSPQGALGGVGGRLRIEGGGDTGATQASGLILKGSVSDGFKKVRIGIR